VVVDSKLPDQVAFGPSTIHTRSFITKPHLAQHIEAIELVKRSPEIVDDLLGSELTRPDPVAM
jgi:hypothetical protein